jgi:hypothetical protein
MACGTAADRALSVPQPNKHVPTTPPGARLRYNIMSWKVS